MMRRGISALGSGLVVASLSMTTLAQEKAPTLPAPAEAPPSAEPSAVVQAEAQDEAAPAAGSEKASEAGASSVDETSSEKKEDKAGETTPSGKKEDEAGEATPIREETVGQNVPLTGEGEPTSEPSAEGPPDDYSEVSTENLAPDETPKKNLVLGIGLDLTIPLGSTASYIGDPSIQGFSLDGRYYAWDNIGVGLSIAFDTLSEKSVDTMEWENVTFSSTQVREISFMPILAKGYYAWRDTEKVIPYVAFGAGAGRSAKRLATGFSSLSASSWHLALAPELGAHLPVGPTVLLGNLRLNYFAPGGGQDGQLFLNISVGVTVQ